MRFVASGLAIVLCLGATAAFAAAPEPTTDEQKTLYALGLAISQSLATFNLNESELELVKSGIADGVFKKTPKVDLQTFGPKIQQLQQARASVVADAERKAGAGSLPNLVEKNQKYTVGAYYSLTENLTLLGEFTDTNAQAHNGVENDSSNFNLGAYLSF